MKKRGEIWMLAGLAVMGLLIAGCSDNQTGPGDAGAAPQGVTTEQQAIEYYAVNDGFVGNDEETFADREVTALDAGSFGKIDAAVTPIRFARVITGITKTVETTFEPGDEVAIAHVTKDITGIFKVLVVTAQNETLMVEKPFNDVSERNVVFKRLMRNPNRFWMNWMPVSSSLVKGGTVPPNNSITIKQLELITGDTTIVITDPLEHYLYYGWMGQHQLRAGLRKCMVPELMGGQEVRIRVTLESTSPDTDFVAVRYGFKNLNWKRFPMTMVGLLRHDPPPVRVDAPYRRDGVPPVEVSSFFSVGLCPMPVAIETTCSRQNSATRPAKPRPEPSFRAQKTPPISRRP